MTIATSIIAAKIQNSAKVVDRWARDEKDAERTERLAERAAQIKNRVARLADADSANLVRGIEGDVARIYFRALGQVVSNTGFEFTATKGSSQRSAGILLRPARDRMYRSCGKRRS